MKSDQDRITIGMHLPHMAVALAGGNMGAIAALRSVAYTEAIGESDRYYLLIALDTQRIYEDRLHRLFRHVCGGDPDKALALFQSLDMGLELVTKDQIQKAIDSENPQLDIDSIYQTVLSERQRRFDKG